MRRKKKKKKKKKTRENKINQQHKGMPNKHDKPQQVALYYNFKIKKQVALYSVFYYTFYTLCDIWGCLNKVSAVYIIYAYFVLYNLQQSYHSLSVHLSSIKLSAFLHISMVLIMTACLHIYSFECVNFLTPVLLISYRHVDNVNFLCCILSHGFFSSD